VKKRFSPSLIAKKKRGERLESGGEEKICLYLFTTENPQLPSLSQTGGGKKKEGAQWAMKAGENLSEPLEKSLLQ